MEDHHFELVAGVLCLDFVNTVGDRSGSWQYVRNYLQRYEDLVSWGEQASVLTLREAVALRALAYKRRDEATVSFTRAIELRETLHALFGSIASGRVLRRDALVAANARLSPLLATSHLAPAPATEGFVCRWRFDTEGGASVFDRVAWSVARSATDLLTSPDLRYVHQCALESCGWLFLDISKNKTRRWCAMKLCGNKAKVRHHRAARKEGVSGGT